MATSRRFDGKTLEDVLRTASHALGVEEDDIHYKLIDEGRRGILGFGARNVCIEVEVPARGGSAPRASRRSADAQPGKVDGTELLPAAGVDGERPERRRNRRRRSRSGGRGPERPRDGARPETAAAAESIPDKNELLGPAGGSQAEGRRSRGGGERGRAGDDEARASQRGRRRGRGGRRRGRRGGQGAGDATSNDREANAGAENRGARRGGRRGRSNQRARPEKKYPPVARETVEAHLPQLEASVREMTRLLGLEAETRAEAVESGARIDLQSDQLPEIRERHPDFEPALQFLLNRMSRRQWPGIGRIQVGEDDRRSVDDEELIAEVREVASQVARTGQAKKLHPMNPYERRLVHLTVREFEGLESISNGESFLKAVTIAPTAPEDRERDTDAPDPTVERPSDDPARQASEDPPPEDEPRG